MQTINKRKLWVAFEGPDGCGKTSIAEALNELVSDSVLTPSPSKSEIGLLARMSLGDLLIEQISTEARQLIFMADIIDSYFKSVIPSLVSGKMVISDRWVTSTLVYHKALIMKEGAKEEAEETTESLADFYSFMTAGQGPDVTFFVDTPEPVRRKRLAAKDTSDIYEDDLELQKYVNRTYKKMKLSSLYSSGMDIRLSISGTNSAEDEAQRCLREIERMTPPDLVCYTGLFNRLKRQGGVDEL